MSVFAFVGGIIVALVIAALDSIRESTRTTQMMTNSASDPNYTAFSIPFEAGQTAQAVRIDPHDELKPAIEALNLKHPCGALFISGGAGGMSEKDVELTRQIVEDGIARFASEHQLTVIDGGTESGVMRMIGQARAKHNGNFTLIGVAPEGRVSYPGRDNADGDAMLDQHHSHFILVNSNEWGGESHVIVNLTHAITDNQKPALGILINGGKVAERDVYLATSKTEPRITIFVLEGSGRTADKIATAFRTGEAQQAILRAIIEGGDIKLIATVEGAEKMYRALKDHFGK